MQDLTLVMAQLDPLVGDIAGNTAAAIEAVREARLEHGADVVVFSELFLTGYPPEDLVIRPSFQETVLRELETLAGETASGGPALLVGTPWAENTAGTPSGTSPSSSTKTAPWLSNPSTT